MGTLNCRNRKNKSREPTGKKREPGFSKGGRAAKASEKRKGKGKFGGEKKKLQKKGGNGTSGGSHR